MTELFDTAVTSLLHLPEVLDRLAAADGDRRSAGHHAAHGHGHGHGHGRVHGLGGGGAPVDIVESPREYAFVLDVPGLSKSDIQVTLEEDRVLVMKGGSGARCVVQEAPAAALRGRHPQVGVRQDPAEAAQGRVRQEDGSSVIMHIILWVAA
uniref:17.5 kDa class II heat shock protein n=1 Tax=Zea mays TaxID=4577 RepID=B6TU62_MAIZE|nr:17.5 kDa class II heat shock protein [Zea mays]